MKTSSSSVLNYRTYPSGSGKWHARAAEVEVVPGVDTRARMCSRVFACVRVCSRVKGGLLLPAPNPDPTPTPTPTRYTIGKADYFRGCECPSFYPLPGRSKHY